VGLRLPHARVTSDVEIELARRVRSVDERAHERQEVDGVALELELQALVLLEHRTRTCPE
jgi:hypothetical protein